MPELGTPDAPLRVAIIGSGPSGFYAAEHLQDQDHLEVQIDMYDRLPTPFGLVRGGVAPDHQKIKSVTKVYEKVAARPGFRFFGNVAFGEHLTLDDLRRHYHQVFFATGAQTDRPLGIPGEDLEGSHSATEFVAWYNGHPDYRHLQFDLSQERVAVVGVGNVAVDVCRILCRTPEELAETDIADYALEALRTSRVREIYMLGRRGPAQAAFTNPEVKELGELQAADVFTIPEEVALDPLSQAQLERNPDRSILKNVEMMQAFAQDQPTGKPRRLVIRFLVSPVEIVGDEHGKVAGLRIVKNELYDAGNGRLSARATDCFEDLPVGLVFRSVGYRGVPLPGVPFDERQGTVLNEKGRILDPETKRPLPGIYAGGWIKRGPSGVIGTNKACSVETVACMLEDLREGTFLHPEAPDAEAAERLVRARQPHYFTFADWQQIDELEVAQGAQIGRPRVKFTCVDDMLAALGRVPVERGA